MYYCNANNSNAIGDTCEGGFVVKKGSIVSDHITSSFRLNGYYKLRKQLEDEGIIIDREFQCDYVFSSFSSAACVVSGRMASGIAEWKTKNKESNSMSKYYITYRELVDMFLDGATEGVSGGKSHNQNLKIVDDLLIHYETVIAERKDDFIYINNTHYSLQSSKLQKMLREIIPDENRKLVYGVEKGYGGKLSVL